MLYQYSRVPMPSLWSCLDSLTSLPLFSSNMRKLCSVLYNLCSLKCTALLCLRKTYRTMYDNNEQLVNCKVSFE
jgi:hypothetical protein